MEIVKLIGSDVLPDDQKLTLEIARVVRLGYLQQNAFHKDDTCVPIEKQAAQMRVILYLYDRARSLVTMGHPMSVLKQSNIFDRVINIKYDVPNDRLDMFDQYMKILIHSTMKSSRKMRKGGAVMAIEYLGLSQINGSLIAIEAMKDAAYDERC